MIRIGKMVFMAVLLALFPQLPVTSMAADTLQGVIKGNVLNKTLNEKAVEGLEITLHRYAQEKDIEVNHTKTDQTGSFSFQDISIDKNSAYYISTGYSGIKYFSEATHFQKEKTLRLDLAVYETTSEDRNIKIKMHHFMLAIDGGGFKIKEVMILENRGDRVYVGSREVGPGKKETLRISLPKNATNLHFYKPKGRFFVKTKEGFTDTTDIKPGEKEILFSYAINSTKSNYRFVKDIALETYNLNFIFPEKGVVVKSDQLKLNGPTGKSGQRFFHLSGKNLAKGSQIVLELGLLQTKNLFKWVVIGLVALLIGVGFALPLRNRRKCRDEEEDGRSPEGEKKALSQTRRAILEAIVELDDLSESGEIRPDEYNMERASLLKKAKEISKQLGLEGKGESPENSQPLNKRIGVN